jgi:NADH-quinone oxidoreductase subunit L
MNDEGDIRRMGGLARYMPVTFATFGLAYLALIGFPGLSGYWSKDPIIEAAFGMAGWRGWVFGGAALLGAGLTAFYMTRLVLMVFFGEKRWENLTSADGRPYHPHESPRVMTIPMIILALGSVGAGFFLAYGSRLEHWLEPTPGIGQLAHSTHPALSSGLVTAAVLVISVLGAAVAWLVVARRPVPVVRPRRVSPVVRAARADLYANAINEALIAAPGTWLTRALVFVDNAGVDGVVNGTAALLGGSSSRLRRFQTGFVRSYALSMLGGSILVIAALLVVRFT